MPDDTTVTFAHHWLVTMRGGERVLEELIHPFPRAQILTLLSDTSALSPRLQKHPIQNSFLQFLPLALRRQYRHLLPCYPQAARRLRLPERTRLLVSSDAALIKAVANPDQVDHICYCHSPPRYLWELEEDYTGTHNNMGLLSQIALKHLSPYLRNVDFQAAQNVTHFIANSKFVQQRILKYYQRDSLVMYPFAAVDQFTPTAEDDGYYLVLSNLVPYKRIDLAVAAFNQLNKPLVVIGTGPLLSALQKQAKPHIRFLGHQPFHKLVEYTEKCRALIFPGIEDFGITPLEAQAAGKPVLAFGAGGVLETVVAEQTGLFFKEQTPESLIQAVQQFESVRQHFDPAACRANAERFHPSVFKSQWLSFLRTYYADLMDRLT